MTLMIDARRQGYDLEQIRTTMTVEQLISILGQYDGDTAVYLSHDNGYTFGGITEDCITEDSRDEVACDD